MSRMTRFLSLLCLTALAAVSIAVPAAFAANVTPWESVSANMGTDPNGAVLIVGGSLPDNAPLPATVELAAPTGSTLQWAGEILGGDASQDVEVATTKSTRDGQDIYTFTLTKARVAQVEVTTVAPVTINGDLYMVDFSIRSWADVPKFGVAVQIPVSAQLSEQPTGTAGLAAGPSGYQFYQQDFSDVKAGQPLGVAFSYKLGAATPAVAAAGTGDSSGTALIVPMLLVAVAVGVGIALVLGVRRKLGATAGDDDDSDRSGPATRERSESAGRSPSAEAFSDDTDVATQSASDDGSATSVAPRSNVALIGTLAVVGVMIAAGVVAGWQGGKARTTGGTISKTFASGEACTNSTLPLAIPEGTTAEQAAEQIFAAVALVPSVTAATIQLDTPSINIGYCESQANEAMLRQAIEPTGYLLAGGVATTTSNEATASTNASSATN